MVCGIMRAPAQRICLTKSQDNIAQINQSPLSVNGRDTLPNEIITIPVVIHVLYNSSSQNISDDQIRSQLAVLNTDFRKTNGDIGNVPPAFAGLSGNARINFCIARVDPLGRPTKGIIHKHTLTDVWTADDAVKFSASGGDDAWDSRRYLNIWVCNLFGRNLGYASLPGSVANKDGVVIQFDVFGTIGSRYPFNKGRTATHEIGHWLGLKHVWGDADCGDDGISDTPPQQTYNNGCPSFPHTSNCSINANGDMFMNFMDFTDDACMYMFSHGQVIKMRSMFATGGFKNSFLYSKVCDSAQAQGIPLPADSTTIISSISMYPNPTTTQVTIACSASDIIGKIIMIYDVLGKLVLSATLTSQKNILYINNLIPGMYIAKIGEGKNITSLRFMKESQFR